MARRRTVGLIATGLVVVLAFTALLAPVDATSPARGWSAGVDSWITDLNTDQRLAPQPTLRWQAGAGGTDAIRIDSTRRYQTMTGFGASMTDSSA
jgi:glucosylceramidase